MPNSTSQQFQIISSLTIVASIVLLLVLATNFMTVREIKYQMADSSNCPTVIENDLQILRGSRLLFSNLNQQVGMLTSINQRYKIENLTKTPIGEVSLVIQPIEPIYLLNSASALYFVTDFGGLILLNQDKSEDTSQYCTLLLAEGFKSSQELVEQKMHTQVKVILQALQDRQLQCNQLQPLDQHTWVVSLTTMDKIVIDPTDLDANLNRLALLMGSDLLVEHNQSDAFLDVRFPLPVLRKSL